MAVCYRQKPYFMHLQNRYRPPGLARYYITLLMQLSGVTLHKDPVTKCQASLDKILPLLMKNTTAFRILAICGRRHVQHKENSFSCYNKKN